MAWHPLPTSDGDGGPGPSSLRESLESLVDSLGGPGVDALVTVHERWPEVVGSEVAGLCRPVAIDEGTLRIRAAGPAWASHLRWAEAEILDRLEPMIGSGAVTSIKVFVARGRSSSGFDQ